MSNINVNIFNFNSNGIQNDLLDGLNSTAFNDVNDILSNIFSDFSQLFDQIGGNAFNGNNPSIAPGGCVVPPSPFDSSHPEGSLKKDSNGVITTPGGYKIEATKQHEWVITGPDGKTTRIWGDPHVAEGDGGKWDFKRDSTFVLGDGTKINVTTKPWGDGGMTVTGGLEIISGNDRVQISDIDKGKGVVGQITQDGFAHANSFGGKDVFVMGKETDDWSFQGKEIIGSNNGGDSFQLGNDLPVGGGNNLWEGNFDFNQLLHNFVNDLINDWNSTWRPNQLGTNPYYNTGNTDNSTRRDETTNNFGNYNRSRHQNQLRDAFRMLGQMFNLLARLSNLNDTMFTMRNRALYA